MIYPFGDFKTLCFSLADCRFLFLQQDRTVDCDVDCDAVHFLCFCVSVNSFCVIMYMLTYVYECFKEIKPS